MAGNICDDRCKESKSCEESKLCSSPHCFHGELCWHAFLHEHGPKVHGYLHRILGNKADAEGCFQDAFIQLVLHIDQYDPTRPLLPFFMRIARNVAYNRVRGRRPILSSDLIEDTPDSHQVEGPLLDDLVLDKAVKWIVENVGLDETQAEIFVLNAVDSLKPKEIAEILGDTPHKTRNKLLRIRDKIRSRVTRKALKDFLDSP